MKVDAETVGVDRLMRDLAAIVEQQGGYVSDALIINEAGGNFWTSVDLSLASPGDILVSYPHQLQPRLSLIEWDSQPDQLRPSSGMDEFNESHRAVIETWLGLINTVGRMQQVIRSLPQLAVTKMSLRNHLAAAGYPEMRRPPSLTTAQASVVAWHSASAADSSVPQDWHLIPLKCFVNHHPQGASQNPLPGRVAVAAASPTDTNETFENYGDLDALQLLMNFGYIDDNAPLVHSVPAEVNSTHLGRIVVRWRSPRNPRHVPMARDVPIVRPTDAGLEIRHLTVRPDNRSRVTTFLAMAVQARSGCAPHVAHAEAEAIIDAILQANFEYYRKLDTLVVDALANPAPPMLEGFGTQEILPLVAQVSLLQQQRLNRMWGN